MKKMLGMAVLAVGGTLFATSAFAVCMVSVNGSSASCGGTNASGGACGWHVTANANGKAIWECALAKGKPVANISLAKWRQSQANGGK